MRRRRGEFLRDAARLFVEVDTVTGFFLVGGGPAPPCPPTERGDKDGAPAVDLAEGLGFSDFG